MKILNKIVTTLVVTLSVCKAENPYWEAFEAERKRSSMPIMSYIEKLAERQVVAPTKENQDALLYFLTTGGKHGFSSRKANEEEKKIFIKSFSVVSMSTPVDNPLNFWDLHKQYRSMDIKIPSTLESYFVFAQTVHSYAMGMREALKPLYSGLLRVSDPSNLGDVMMENLDKVYPQEAYIANVWKPCFNYNYGAGLSYEKRASFERFSIEFALKFMHQENDIQEVLKTIMRSLDRMRVDNILMPHLSALAA